MHVVRALPVALHDWRPASNTFNRLSQFFRGDQIRLRQKHYGLGMADPDYYEVALQSSDIEIEVAGLHDERHIEVGGNHLEIDVAAIGLTPHKESSWQYVSILLCALALR